MPTPEQYPFSKQQPRSGFLRETLFECFSHEGHKRFNEASKQHPFREQQPQTGFLWPVFLESITLCVSIAAPLHY
jgi:hypothetical protein